MNSIISVTKRSLLFAATLLLLAPVTSSYANAQTASGTTPPPPQAQQATEAQAAPAANAADVATLDGIMHAVYDVISGPAGQKRDWNRMRSLFIPGARLIPTFERPTGDVASRVLTVEDYITRGGPRLEAEGFFERESARRVEQFGNIAHVFSTYESRHKAEDAKPFARGINSFQLMNDGKRWWVVTIFWQEETTKNPLPKQYLETKKD